MKQYYKASVKMSYEDKKGNLKFKKETFLISGISPTDVETKLAKHLGVEDYEIVGINVANISEVIE